MAALLRRQSSQSMVSCSDTVRGAAWRCCPAHQPTLGSNPADRCSCQRAANRGDERSLRRLLLACGGCDTLRVHWISLWPRSGGLHLRWKEQQRKERSLSLRAGAHWAPQSL